MDDQTPQCRPLTTDERRLVRWMLEHGGSAAEPFLSQLELASVTPWRCPCGCASINFVLEGHSIPTGGMRPIADFVTGGGEDLSGIFVYAQDSLLAGLEVYGLAGDAPKTLPAPKSLKQVNKNPSE